MDESQLSEGAEKFATVFGLYVMLTSATEMAFMDLLALVLADDTGAHRAIWLQFQSTRSRLDMVRHTYRNRFGPAAPETENLSALVHRFKGLSRQRNYYAHAYYHVDDNGDLTATGFRVTEDEDGISMSSKPLDTAAINEVTNLYNQMTDLSGDIKSFTTRLQDALIADGRLLAPILALER